MIPLDFHYLWPAGAYLILFSFAVLFLYGLLSYYRDHIPFNRDIIEDRSKRLFWVKSILASLTVALCAIALMQPVGNARYPEGTIPPKTKNFTHPLELKRKAHEFIFLVDASASMEIKDTRLQKSRLDYAKSIADELIASLTGETASLFAFTSQPFLLSPATLDYLFVRLSLKEIEINEGGIPGTSLVNIIAEIQKRYFPENTPITHKLKTVILLSDGGDTDIEALSGDEKRNKIAQLTAMLNNASKQNLRFYTIGIGSTSGGTVPNVTENRHSVQSRLDREILEAVAKSGSGRYFEANNYSPSKLAKALLEDVAKDPPYYETTQTEIENALLQSLLSKNNFHYDRYYQIPIGLALLCLGFILFIPDRLTKFFAIGIIMISFSSVLSAEEDDLPYQSAMYQAKGYVEAKMFREARDIYENLLNSQLGSFQKAALQYNIGTTYLDEQVWDQAIAKLSPLAVQSTSLNSLDNKIHKNLALAQYGKAISLEENRHIQILKRLESAATANSFLPIEQREPLQETLKRLISKMHLVIDQQSIESEPNRENLQKVYNHLDDLQKLLPLFSMPDASKSLKRTYSNFFSSEQQPWLRFWEEIGNKIKENKSALPLTKEIDLLLNELTKEIQYENTTTAIELAQQVKEKLNALMDMLARDPAEEKLLQLLNSFKRLLVRHNWKGKEWMDLNPFYSSLEKLELKPDIKLAITNSQHHLSQALEAAKTGMFMEAKLFAESAIRWLQIALVSLPETSSLNLLATLIEQQQDALNLMELQSSAASELIQDTQKGVFSLSDLYYPRVYKEQTESFKKGLCQAIPWGAALPLFDEGKRAAFQANENIHSPEVRVLQDKAIEAWRKTWIEIKNPTSQHSSCSEGNSAKNEPSPASQESLSTLLQMELDDRKPPVPAPTSIEIKRPW